jgi:hypothetical protein
MLNMLRTDTFSQNGRNKSMLGTIDSLEQVLKSMQNQLEIDHQMIVQRDRQLAEAALENRLQKEKLTLLENELRLQISKRFGRSTERWTPLYVNIVVTGSLKKVWKLMLSDAQEKDSELRLAGRVMEQVLMTTYAFWPRRHAA